MFSKTVSSLALRDFSLGETHFPESALATAKGTFLISWSNKSWYYIEYKHQERTTSRKIGGIDMEFLNLAICFSTCFRRNAIILLKKLPR